jgi:hypothetical protein
LLHFVRKHKQTMIQFVLLVNKQGQTRLAQYTHFKSIHERTALEGEIVRKCLGRNEDQVLFKLKTLTNSVLFWST